MKRHDCSRNSAWPNRQALQPLKWKWTFFFISIPLFPYTLSPITHPKFFFSTFGVSFKNPIVLHNLQMLFSLNPTIYLITLPIIPKHGKVLWRDGSDESSWWVSRVANKSDGFAGAALGGARTRHSFLGSLKFGFSLLFGPCALLGLWRRTFDGVVALLCGPGSNKDRLLNKLLFLRLFLSAFSFGCRWASHHLT